MKWLFFIVLFIAAVFFGVEIMKDPGYALFVYHGWSVQMPLWLALLLFLFLFFCVYVCARLFCRLMLWKYSLKFWWFKRSFQQKHMQNQKTT